MAEEVAAPDSPPRAGHPFRRLFLGLAPAALTLAAAIYSLVVIGRADARTASEEHWRDAAGLVEEQISEGDLIVFAPAWIDPLGRRYLGGLMSIEMAARMDAARFSRIWEVALAGHRAPETRGLRRRKEHAFGPLRLALYEQEAAEVRFDFTRQWRRAEVAGPAARRPARVLAEVGFAPHHCIQVIPRPDETVSLRFDDVPLGDRIVGYVGLADVFTRRDVRDPGQLELRVRGASVVTRRTGVDDGWVRFEVATEPGPADVEFRLTAVGEAARDRRICFAAEARE